MVSLIVQQLYREILAVADEHGGKLPNRVMMDEIYPPKKTEENESAAKPHHKEKIQRFQKPHQNGRGSMKTDSPRTGRLRWITNAVYPL